MNKGKTEVTDLWFKTTADSTLSCVGNIKEPFPDRICVCHGEFVIPLSPSTSNKQNAVISIFYQI